MTGQLETDAPAGGRRLRTSGAGPGDSEDRRTAALPSVPDLMFCIVAPVLAFGAAVRLTQSDGDLAAHIRVGETMLATHALPPATLSSYTVAGVSMPTPAWLSEVLFAWLYRFGGLALIACVTAVVAAGVHALVAWFLRRRGVDARWILLASLLALALGATHWLARPHKFTIAGTAVLLVLLESGSAKALFGIVPLFAVWANLHGGWLFGLALVGLYAVGDAIEWAAAPEEARWRRRLGLHVAALAAAVLAVLVNPYGAGLYRQVLGTLGGAAPAGMEEFRAPDFQQPDNLVFLLAIVVCVTLLALQRRRLPAPWLAVLVGTLVAALQSGRNIALFGVSGWVLLALHASHGTALPTRLRSLFADFARAERRARVGIWSVPVALGLMILGLNHGRFAGRALVADDFQPSRFPVAAIARARAAGLAGRTFLPWTWSGYAELAWPGQPLHVDPLKFSDETLRSYLRIIAVRPGWGEELARWNVRLAVLPAHAPLADALRREAGWTIWSSDPTAVVLQRPGS